MVMIDSKSLLGFSILLVVSACGSRSLLPSDGGAENGNGGGEPSGGAPPTTAVTSPDLDVLIVIDNSIGMSTKHPLLATHVEQLVHDLVEPPCIDSTGNTVPSEGKPCLAGSTRAY